jgi:hypothetical protein
MYKKIWRSWMVPNNQKEYCRWSKLSLAQRTVFTLTSLFYPLVVRVEALPGVNSRLDRERPGHTILLKNSLDPTVFCANLASRDTISDQN